MKNNIKKTYVVQMEEIEVCDESKETIDVWENFFESTNDLEEAKKNADKLLNDIKEHKISEVFELKDNNNYIGVCIAEYDEENDTILDVIEVGELSPEEWNIKCGSCGAFCSEGTCYKYGERVTEDTIAKDCWHSL